MKQTREQFIQIRVTPKEKDKIKQRADKKEMSVAEYIRYQCVYAKN